MRSRSSYYIKDDLSKGWTIFSPQIAKVPSSTQPFNDGLAAGRETCACGGWLWHFRTTIYPSWPTHILCVSRTRRESNAYNQSQVYARNVSHRRPRSVHVGRFGSTPLEKFKWGEELTICYSKDKMCWGVAWRRLEVPGTLDHQL